MTLADEQSIQHIAGLVRASDRHSEELAQIRHALALLIERFKVVEKELGALTTKVQHQRNDINKLYIGHPNL